MENYITKYYVCWKCNKKTAVYTWAGHQLWAKNCPVVGRPSTVRFMWSNTISGRYWANSCEHCGSILGDWFLYCEPGGPFCG